MQDYKEKIMLLSQITATHISLEISQQNADVTIQGGVLGTNVYTMDNIHFHWGETAHEGSEHFLNAESFGCEAHLVFYNKEEAHNHGDGMAVVAVFGTVSEKNNKLIDPLCNAVSSMVTNEQPVTIDFQSACQWVLSGVERNTQKMFSYEGSLTTPPFSESVRFLVLPIPIKISEDQIATFRSLKNEEGNNILSNTRRIQRINKRMVVRCRGITLN